jgi:hypothetical protein
MTVWLGQQEAVNRFQAYLVYAAKHSTTPSRDSHLLNSEEEPEDDDLNDLNDPTISVGKPSMTSHSVSVAPGYPHISLSSITTDFKAPGFLSALKTYIRRAYPPPALPLLPTAADHFDVYKRVNISQLALPQLPTTSTSTNESISLSLHSPPWVKMHLLIVFVQHEQSVAVVVYPMFLHTLTWPSYEQMMKEATKQLRELTWKVFILKLFTIAFLLTHLHVAS